MARHVFTVQNTPEIPCLDCIKNGQKKVEGRANKPAYKLLNVGDLVEFRSENSLPVICKINFIHYYKNIEDYLLTEGVQNALPWLNDFEIAMKIYRSFYSDELLSKIAAENNGFSFMAIGIKIHENS